MIRPLFAAVLGVSLASALAAQSITVTPLIDESDEILRPPAPPPEPAPERGENGVGAVLRALDKVSGETADLELPAGYSGQIFGLEVGLTECRYPAGNPAGDAFAYLVIRDIDHNSAAFAGWMVASSPALNALDHSRYDVWVLRCMTS